MVTSIRKNSIIIASIFLIIMSMVLRAGNDEELFLRGNKYYEQHDYDKALASYALLSKKGGAVLYNMGNVYYHQHDYAHALVYWKRAQKGASATAWTAIEKNKQQVLKKLGIATSPTCKQMIIEFFQQLNPYFSILFLQLFFLFIWYLFVYLAHKKGRLKKSIAALLSMIVIITGIALGVDYHKRCMQTGIVVLKKASIFSGPDKKFHVLSPLAYAAEVLIKEKREGWYKIQYTDIIGWIEDDVIQMV